MATEADWEMEMHPDGRPLRVDHFAAVPGSRSIVVSRRYTRDASPPEPDWMYDVVVFDGPTIRPGRISIEYLSFLGSTLVVPAEAREVFLMGRSRHVAYALGPDGLTSQGTEGDGSGYDYGPMGGTAIEVMGTILTRRGQWLDPRLPGELGYSSLGFDDDVFGFDPARGVVAWYKSGDRPMLRLLSPHNLQELTALALGPAERLTAPVIRLEPAGPDRWLLVHNRQVHLIPITTPGPAPAVDLGVTATVTERDDHRATARIIFQITNHSSVAASDVELSLGLPRAAYTATRLAYLLVDNATNAIRSPNALLGQMFKLGGLEPGASYEFPVVLPTVEPGKIAVSAVVGSAAPDPDPSDNRTEIRLTLEAPLPVLRLLPPDSADPETLRFEYTTGYAHVYRIERALSVEGPWEDILNQDVIANGEPSLFMTGKPSADQDAYWRVRRVWPE